jgi:SAM-dependent methyltransferase
MSALELAVLRHSGEIAAAEQVLVERGLLDQVPDGFGIRIKRRLGLPGPSRTLIPDPRKSWDVQRALEALEENCTPDDPVLDIGSLASAIPPALHRLGYRRVHGIDLNPQVRQMPHADDVDYRVGDMMSTPFEDGYFGAITAISVIEHDFAPGPLLEEVRRLLRPNGFFFFSTDYWPEKIDTGDARPCSMDWTLFSADEITAFLQQAAELGLEPVAEPGQAIRTVGERPISFGGFDYTFLAGALIRRR